MYSIYSDGICIHEDIYSMPEYKVVGAKLTLEENAAGSLTLTIPPQNVGYTTVKRLSSAISVRREGEEIWSGRVVDEKEDFWKRRILTCEGELGYLNDSVQPPAEYTGLTVIGFLNQLLNVHNSKCKEQFRLGAVTMTDDGHTYTWRTNYETTMQCVSEKLVGVFGGRVRVRKVDGVRYLDYLAEYPNTNSQIVEFGKNLLDFTKTWDLTELATVVIPRGKKLDKSPIKDMDAYTTVESVNGGSIYVAADTIAQFGRIEQVVDWPDVSDPAQLLEKAREYLRESQFENLVLEVSMVDLHLMSGSTEPVAILDQLQCRSYLHGMDKVFPVTKIVLPLDHPEQAKYTLGKSERMSLTESTNKASSAILERIEALPTKESILDEARKNADAIMNMATNGYITITKGEHGTNELYISDTRNYKDATRYWRWNLNGLAYYDKNNPRYNNANSLVAAITMDGAIVANFITVGTMSADRVRTGILESVNKNTIFNLDTGELTMEAGSINIGNNFIVDKEGNLTARRGTFAGELVAVKGTFAGVVQAEDFLDKYGHSMMDGMKFSSEYLDLYGLTVRRRDNNQVSFQITENGAVSINGNVTMGTGSSINWAQVGNYNLDYNPAYTLASTANGAARAAAEAADSAKDLAEKIANGEYINGTFINGTTVMAPTLAGNIVVGGTFLGKTFKVLAGGGGSFVLSAGEYSDIFTIAFNDMGGYGPEAVIRGNGGTLTFSNWAHIIGLDTTATFA